MKRFQWFFFSLVIVIINLTLLITGSGAAQALMLRLTLDDMSRNADTIVMGTVISKSSQWNAERTHINTSVVVSVEETIKGVPGQKTVTITVPGGTAEGITEWVEDAPRFQPGERSVVFLRQLPASRFEVYGHYQGKLPVVGGKVSGMPLTLFRERVSRAVKSTSALEKDTRQPVGPVFLDVTKLAPPQAVPQQSAVKSPGWQAILEDGFEGTFPGVWSVSGNVSSGGHTWGKNSWNVYSGSSSAWCAGSTLNPATSNYANNMNAWMVYGPFNLSDAGAAELWYYRWRMSEAVNDRFWVFMSTDGSTFWGWWWSGAGDTWESVGFDLREWYHYGNLCGQSQVWLAFKFDSNASVNDKGVFLDNVGVYKYVGAIPQITSIVPSSASAGTNSTITISGTNFGATPGYVDFYYQYGEPYISGDIISWSNTSIVSTVPTGIINSYPASASSGPLYVTTAGADGVYSMPYPFTVTFSYGGVKWAGTDPVVNYRVNSNTPDCTGEEVAVQNAANTWNAVPNKNFAFNYAGSTSAIESNYNGTNEILWRDLGTTGVIAHARYWWNASNNLVETDIEFNDNNTYWTWSTAATPAAGQFDVHTIALHELGHWLNLRDLYGDEPGYPQDVDKVMFGWGDMGVTKRTLHATDQAGIQWIYPAATVPPTVTTDNATNITDTSATLNGTLVSLGSSSNVTCSLQFGLTTNYTYEVGFVPFTTNATSFSATKIDLSPNTTYHFRAKAVGASGTAYGGDRTFTTNAGTLPVSDNFNDNTTDNSLWVPYQVGSGTIIAETNQRLEITHSANSTGTNFGAGYSSNFWLRGDFDIQVDYQLLVWPNANGVRVGFDSDLGTTERTSYGNATNDFPGQPREVYSANFRAEGGQGITPTSDLSGKLRMVRSGSIATGYYFSSDTWVPIHSGNVTTGDFNIRLASWSHDNVFMDKEVKVAFDNFAVNQGQLVWPPTVTTDNATGISGRSALLSGTLTSLGSSSNVTLSFQYGTSTNYTGETASITTRATGPFSIYLSGLSENTTYHFRAKAAGIGTGYGADRTFTTPAMTITRDMPDSVLRGQTFQVSINFTAPANQFNAIGLSDFVPTSFNITANKVWCDPDADVVKLTANRVDYIWYGPDNPDQTVGYPQGTALTALYQATVPAGATPGVYTFNGFLEYYIGTTGPLVINTGGDSTVRVLAEPSVTTDNATDVSGRSALLNGTLTSLGDATSVQLSFQWGTSTNYTGETPSITTNATGPFTVYLSGLSENTTYHFRAKAVGFGTGYGVDRTFTTPVVNVVRDLPGYAARGQTFQVSINFTAPANLFNAVGLSDFVPVSWNITANKAWCTPAADQSKLTVNRIDYIWYGPDNPDQTVGYGNGTAFTAIYQVTVPADATPGFYRFTGGYLEYYTGSSGPSIAGIGGDYLIEVLEGARIEGVTYEVKGVVLGSVTITLDGASSVVSDGNGYYRLTAATTGSHSLVASKTGFRNYTQTVNVTDLSAGYTIDFKGNNGLVPNAPNLSYVLACINKWKFPGTDGTGLGLSKVLSVINAWKFPL